MQAPALVPSLCPAGLIPLQCLWQQTWASCWVALLTLRHPEVAGLEGGFAAATQGARSHFWAGKCRFVPAERACGGEQNSALRAIRGRSFSFCRPLNRIFSLLQDIWGSAPRGARWLQGSAMVLLPRHPEHPLPTFPPSPAPAPLIGCTEGREEGERALKCQQQMKGVGKFNLPTSSTHVTFGFPPDKLSA